MARKRVVNEQGERFCPDCKTWKSENEDNFYRRPSGWFLTYCKQCHNKRQMAIPRKVRMARQRQSKVGCTPELYQQLFIRQQGVCAVCGQPDPFGTDLAADHNHHTGHIRGLLCRNCNLALGYLKDDPNLVLSLLSYLQPEMEGQSVTSLKRHSVGIVLFEMEE